MCAQMSRSAQECQAGAQTPLFPRSRPRDQVGGIFDNDDISANEDPGDKREKKVSPWWLFASLPFLNLAASAVVAPRIEVYTNLVCRVLRPDYSDQTHFRHLMFGPGDEQSRRCASDPAVQAELSKLVAALMLSSGIGSCITTSWWSSFSDRHGRNRVLGISVFSIIASSLNIIFVSSFASHLPGNYWFLLVGSIMEGLLGGVTTIFATVEAYVVDCSDSSSRSRMLSIVTGILAAGVAFGPVVGDFLISASNQLLSVFYGSIVVFVCFVVFAWTWLPESLPQEQMLANKHKYAARPPSDTIWSTFLAPLSMFLPTKLESTPGSSGQRGRDWSLTLIVIAYAIVTMISIPVDHLLQYTNYVFGWTGKMNRYWLSLLGMTRAVFCLLLLPVMIKWLKKDTPATRLPIESAEPLLPLDPDSLPVSQMHSLEHVPSATFDLSLARVSLLIFMVSYFVMGLASTSSVFTVSSTFAQFSSGYLPGLHSVAMDLYVQRERRARMREDREGEDGSELIPVEVGKLYGSLAVIQALCAQALGPAIFALIFMVTVSSVPAAIFLFTVGATVAALYLLSCVRLPDASPNNIGSRD